MSELISGKEALIALANGEDVELRNLKDTWYKEWTDYSSFRFKTWIGFFIEGESNGYEFRIKPKTINLNGIEVPAPFEPKEGDHYWYIDDEGVIFQGVYDGCSIDKNRSSFLGVYKTEDQAVTVRNALRSIFKGE